MNDINQFGQGQPSLTKPKRHQEETLKTPVEGLLSQSPTSSAVDFVVTEERNITEWIHCHDIVRCPCTLFGPPVLRYCSVSRWDTLSRNLFQTTQVRSGWNWMKGGTAAKGQAIHLKLHHLQVVKLDEQIMHGCAFSHDLSTNKHLLGHFISSIWQIMYVGLCAEREISTTWIVDLWGTWHYVD